MGHGSKEMNLMLMHIMFSPAARNEYILYDSFPIKYKKEAK